MPLLVGGTKSGHAAAPATTASLTAATDRAAALHQANATTTTAITPATVAPSPGRGRGRPMAGTAGVATVALCGRRLDAHTAATDTATGPRAAARARVRVQGAGQLTVAVAVAVAV